MKDNSSKDTLQEYDMRPDTTINFQKNIDLIHKIHVECNEQCSAVFSYWIVNIWLTGQKKMMSHKIPKEITQNVKDKKWAEKGDLFTFVIGF